MNTTTTEQVTTITDLSTISKPDGILRGRVYAPTEEDIKALAESIELSGQLQPCAVRKMEDGAYQLIYGSTRYEAIEYLQSKGIDIGLNVIVKEVESDFDALRMSLAENRDRVDISPIDQAGIVAYLKENGVKKNVTIAEILGCSPAWIGQLQKLDKLSDKHKQMIHRGELPVQAGVAISKIKDEQQRDAIVSKAPLRAGDINGSAIERMVKDTLNPPSSDSTEDVSNETETDTSRKLPAFRDFLEDLLTPDDVDPAIKELAKKTLRWLDGKDSDRQLTNAYDKLLAASPTETE